jgi:hypothetical protein
MQLGLVLLSNKFNVEALPLLNQAQGVRNNKAYLQQKIVQQHDTAHLIEFPSV